MELIHDGRTKEMEKQHFRIRKIVEDAEKLQKGSGAGYGMDEFIFESKGDKENTRLTEQLNACFSKWKNFSSCRYVVNLLCEFSNCDCSEQEKIQLFEEMERKKSYSKKSKEIIDYLVVYLEQRIEEVENDELRRGLQKQYTKDVISSNLITLQEDFFAEFLAPILDLDLKEINTFLTRVLKKDQLCNFIPREYLLELAVRLNEKFAFGPTMDVLYELKKYYEACHPVRGEGVLEIKGTGYIAKNYSVDLEKMVKRGNIFKIADYPEVIEVLEAYKALQKPSSRNRSETYETLFEEVVDCYEEELELYLSSMKEAEKKRAKVQNREAMRVPVTIWYKSPEKDIVIPKNACFVGENCVYESGEEIHLSKKDYVQVCVHFYPHEENVEYVLSQDYHGKQRKNVPTGAEFHVLEGNRMKNGKPLVGKVIADNIKKYHPKYDSNSWTKPCYLSDPKKKGFVVLELLAGESVPKDLVIEHQGFRFVPEEEECGIVHDLSVSVMAYADPASIKKEGMKKEGKKEKNGNYVIDEIGSIKEMQNCPECVLKISNQSDRVTVPLRLFDEKMNFIEADSTVKRGEDSLLQKSNCWDTFCNYMYGVTDFMEVSDLDVALEDKIGLKLHCLSSDWLEETMILGNSEWFVSLDEYRQRNVLLFLLFLIYIKNNYKVAGRDRERFVNNFDSYIEKRMEELRLDGLYWGYPFDSLLRILLEFCDQDDMVDTLRVIYKEYRRQKGEN